MTDRFDAQLRQHLLGTANDRPAQGQLAEVVDAVAVTRQRHQLVARLTWTPGRIGAFPSSTIRYGLVAVALVFAMVAGAVVAGGLNAGPSTVFEGTWITIDPADGSGMTLVVGPGNTPAVYFEDGYASGAACVDDPVKRFAARGTGEISGNRLLATFPDGGGCGLVLVDVGGRYNYIQASDTLVDQDDLGWSRALGSKQVETQAPTTQPAATDPSATEPTATEPGTEPAATEPTAIDLGPKCFDIPAGQTYRQGAGALSLTLTIPAAAEFEWQGYRDAFEMAGLCHFGRPVLITASTVELVFAACTRNAAGGPRDLAMAVGWLTESDAYTASEPTELTIDGYPATRFEIRSDTSRCSEGIFLWGDRDVPPGATTFVYLVDVHGTLLGITVENRDDEAPPAQVAEAEALVASLQIEP